jgi:hypothetical protein
MPENRKLRLIRGGYPSATVGSVRVVPAPQSSSPFDVDAIVHEEDTFLVLSADAVVRDPGEPILKTLTEAHEAEPETPGSVVVRGGHPLELLAVVHDLARDPTWKEEWVATALQNILVEAKNRELRSLSMPLLGSLHGKLAAGRVAELLGAALRNTPTGSLERVWLVAPADRCMTLLQLVQTPPSRLPGPG